MSLDGFDILVCQGPECAGQRHADQVFRGFRAALERRSQGHSSNSGYIRPGRVVLDRRKCFGRCQRGPNVYVRARRRAGLGSADDGDNTRRVRSALYNGVGNENIAADVEDILTTHVLGGVVLERLIQRHDEADLALEYERIRDLESESNADLAATPDSRPERSSDGPSANPRGGDPMGTGSDVRLAVAMRALGPRVQASNPSTESPTSEPPTGVPIDITENG